VTDEELAQALRHDQDELKRVDTERNKILATRKEHIRDALGRGWSQGRIAGHMGRSVGRVGAMALALKKDQLREDAMKLRELESELQTLKGGAS
jgi:hypothetical protein